jgi:hypothetical protein
MKSNLTFVSYARRFSSGEAKQAASIPDQDNTFREVIAWDSLEVVKKYRESQSALKPDIRPVYCEIVNHLKSGKANAVLIWHVNSISRNPKESGEIQQLLHDGVIQCVRTPKT